MIKVETHGGYLTGRGKTEEVKALTLSQGYYQRNINSKGERYTFVNRDTNNRSVVKFDSKGLLIWDKQVGRELVDSANEDNFMTFSNMNNGTGRVDFYNYDRSLIKRVELSGVPSNSVARASTDMKRIVVHHHNGVLLYDDEGTLLITRNINHGQSNIYTYTSESVAVHYSTSMYGAFQYSHIIDLNHKNEVDAGSIRAFSLESLSILGIYGLFY